MQTTKPSPPTLGFVGIGLMGTPMSKRLLQAGYSVNVWNRNPEKCQPLQDCGANICQDLQQLVKNSDVVMLCVSDTSAVEQVVFGTNGVASQGASDKVLVDFSSISPESTRDFARRLEDQCGMEWVDSPVSGGVVGAENGSLVVMAGGHCDTVNALQPIFDAVSQRVTYMGPVGSGQATKVCNQMLVGCNLMVIAEVIALAEKAGVDSSRLPQALAGGFADSIPLQLTGSRMAQRELDEVKWHIKTLVKDLTMAENLACQEGAETPMSRLAWHLMNQFADQGNGDKDPATLILGYT